MFHDRINMRPNYAEHHKTLYQVAVAEGVKSLVEIFLDYWLTKKEPDFDCIKMLRDLCQKGRIDVTYNFHVMLKCSGEKRFSCCIRILEDYIGAGIEDNLKESYISSTWALLINLCADRVSCPIPVMDNRQLA